MIDTRGRIGRWWSKLHHPPTNRGNKMNLSMPQNGGSLLALLPRSYFILPILNAVNSDRHLHPSFPLCLFRSPATTIATGCYGIELVCVVYNMYSTYVHVCNEFMSYVIECVLRAAINTLNKRDILFNKIIFKKIIYFII